MKYFFDTEFIEHATGIQLVSIGIVREDGRTFYAESSSFDERLADKWVTENVIAKLRYYNREVVLGMMGTQSGSFTSVYDTEVKIKKHLFDWLVMDEKPEFYAYYASYDWVVFARIFGRMIDLPAGFPMWVIDLKQMMWERGLTKEWKQEVCPDPEGEHDALVDARWNMQLHSEIIKHPVK